MNESIKKRFQSTNTFQRLVSRDIEYTRKNLVVVTEKTEYFSSDLDSINMINEELENDGRLFLLEAKVCVSHDSFLFRLDVTTSRYEDPFRLQEMNAELGYSPVLSALSVIPAISSSWESKEERKTIKESSLSLIDRNETYEKKRSFYFDE